MNMSTKFGFSFWVILVLVIMNIGLLGFLWVLHFKKPTHLPIAAKVDSEELFKRELQLDQQQFDSLKILREGHFRQRDSIQFEIMRLNRQVMEELFKNTPDTLLVQELFEQIGREQKEVGQITYDHFNEIKKICRPEQYERLKQLVFDAIELKQPPPPGGKHRPPPSAANRPPHGR